MSAHQVQNTRETTREKEPYSHWRDRDKDLIALVLIGVLLPFVPLISVSLVRIPVGLILALCLPGFALAATLFPKPSDLDWVTRAVVSFGLSVALIPLMTLILSALPWGIRPWPITMSLSIWTISLGSAAILRRRALGRIQTPVNGEPRRRSPWSLVWRGQSLDSYLLAGGTLIGLVAISFVSGWFIHPTVHLTEFYVLGQEGMADQYPREAILNDDIELTLGVVSEAPDRQAFSVEVWAVDQAGSEDISLLATLDSIRPQPGQSVEFDVSFRMPWTGLNQEIVIYLYRVGDDVPYRQLQLWIDVVDEPPA